MGLDHPVQSTRGRVLPARLRNSRQPARDVLGPVAAERTHGSSTNVRQLSRLELGRQRRPGCVSSSIKKLSSSADGDAPFLSPLDGHLGARRQLLLACPSPHASGASLIVPPVPARRSDRRLLRAALVGPCTAPSPSPCHTLVGLGYARSFSPPRTSILEARGP